MMNGDKAFRGFFKGQSGFPKFKKKKKSDVKVYFVKNNPNDCKCERHRIHIPTTKQGYHIKSGTVSYQVGRYYVSIVIDIYEDTR